MNEPLPDFCGLQFASVKERGLEESVLLPDGRCVTVEGYVTAINAQRLLKKGDSTHKMQILSLTSNSSLTEGDSVSIVLWDEEEFKAEVGEKVRVIGGILREGKIHVIHSARLERIEGHEAYSEEDVETKNEAELTRHIEKELGRILSYYRQKINCTNIKRVRPDEIPGFSLSNGTGEGNSRIKNIGSLKATTRQYK
ncbi:MAG: hypothetical protein ACXACI_16830 [Candidatus Hodarchaeales archaeon]|jgi:hypothetical protein